MRSNLNNKKILIVEDSDDNRLIATILLRRAGLEPVSACDGLEALEYMRTHSAPALIVLDIQMPRMDGWQFLVAMRKDPNWVKLPVVICSCQSSRTLVRELPANVFAWIDKVDMTEHLLAVVRDAMAQQLFIKEMSCRNLSPNLCLYS